LWRDILIDNNSYVRAVGSLDVVYADGDITQIIFDSNEQSSYNYWCAYSISSYIYDIINNETNYKDSNVTSLNLQVTISEQNN